MPATTTAGRLAVLEERVARSTALLEEIHLAVIGSGDARSSLRERVTALETAHDHESGWKFRSVNAGAIAVVSSGLAYISHLLTLAVPHP